MFLETFSARLPPPLAAQLPRGQCWDPCPRPPVPTGRTGLGWGPPGPAGTPGPTSPGLVPRSAASAAAHAPQPARPPQGRCGSDIGAWEPLCDPSSPCVAFLTGVGAGLGRARGKDFKLSIEQVSLLFLIKSFFKR